jgi:alpha-L-fucosidase
MLMMAFDSVDAIIFLQIFSKISLMNKNRRRKILVMVTLLIMLTGMLTVCFSQTYTPQKAWHDAQIATFADKSAAAQIKMNWWTNARFGMFIHWNPSSVIGTEISWSKQFYADDGETLLPNPRPDAGFSGGREHNEWLSWFKPAAPASVYDNLIKSFYPGSFDADKIAATARNAGMKYIIMVAKHHDGFCMWNSKFTNFDVMATPFKRDILKEMAVAARKAGLRFGIYYSQRDWHHPYYSPATMKRYNAYMRNQVQELLTNYGDISVIFFDAGEWKTHELWEGEKLFKLIYALQPNIIINDRCGVPADYTTPEQTLGEFNNSRHWESCMTFTGFWSWHGFQTPVIPYEECLKYLVSCAGGDGNLLMNVGPLPTGEIDPREAERMQRVGKWLKQFGGTIYGTRGGPFLPDSNIVSTCKNKTVFIHLLKAEVHNLKLPKLDAQIEQAAIVGGSAIAFLQTPEAITLTIPAEIKLPAFSVIELTLNKPITGKLIAEK